MQLKLSIIIPVYNVQKYVKKCILSCENQDIPKSSYELIVINDGSTDDSYYIVDKISKEFNNIKVYSQENQGLSVSRNNGLKYSIGEYIWFVDSDDWIEDNCLGRIVNTLEAGDIDILQIRHRKTYDDAILNTDDEVKFQEKRYSGKDILRKGGLASPAQFSIFKKSFLINNSLLFTPSIYHEDTEFKPRATYFAKIVSFDNIVSYNYYQRPSGNIMTNLSYKRAKDMLFVCGSLYDFSIKVENEIKPIFYDYISSILNSFFLIYRNYNIKERSTLIRELKEKKHLLRCMLKSNHLKYRVEGIFFNVNLSIGLFMHRIIR